MRILALDTSTEACSVALLQDNHCDEYFRVAPQQHTHLLLPMVDELLQSHQLKTKNLDAIAFGQGPGSFTGLRIAAGVAQGLAFPHSLPLVPVSSLAALALAAHEAVPSVEYVASLIDARMREVYFALYRFHQDEMKEIIPDSLNNPHVAFELLASQLKNNTWVAVGKAWEMYGNENTHALELFRNSTPVENLCVGSVLESSCTNVGMKVLCSDPSSTFLTGAGFESALLAKFLMQEAYPSAKYVAQLAAQSFKAKNFAHALNALPKYLRNNVVG